MIRNLSLQYRKTHNVIHTYLHACIHTYSIVALHI